MRIHGIHGSSHAAVEHQRFRGNLKRIGEDFMEFAGIFFYGLQVTASYQHHEFITAQTGSLCSGDHNISENGLQFHEEQNLPRYVRNSH